MPSTDNLTIEAHPDCDLARELFDAQFPEGMETPMNAMGGLTRNRKALLILAAHNPRRNAYNGK